jgi:hypothetical protein
MALSIWTDTELANGVEMMAISCAQEAIKILIHSDGSRRMRT